MEAGTTAKTHCLTSPLSRNSILSAQFKVPEPTDQTLSHPDQTSAWWVGISVVTAGTTHCTVSEARKQGGKSPACLWPRSLGEKVQDKPPYENVVSRGCD